MQSVLYLSESVPRGCLPSKGVAQGGPVSFRKESRHAPRALKPGFRNPENTIRMLSATRRHRADSRLSDRPKDSSFCFGQQDQRGRQKT